MEKMTDKILNCMAYTIEDAFEETLGLASFGGSYEPEMPEAAKQYKAAHTSKLERLYNKITRASD